MSWPIYTWLDAWSLHPVQPVSFGFLSFRFPSLLLRPRDFSPTCHGQHTLKLCLLYLVCLSVPSPALKSLASPSSGSPSVLGPAPPIWKAGTSLTCIITPEMNEWMHESWYIYIYTWDKWYIKNVNLCGCLALLLHGAVHGALVDHHLHLRKGAHEESLRTRDGEHAGTWSGLESACDPLLLLVEILPA